MEWRRWNTSRTGRITVVNRYAIAHLTPTSPILCLTFEDGPDAMAWAGCVTETRPTMRGRISYKQVETWDHAILWLCSQPGVEHEHFTADEYEQLETPCWCEPIILWTFTDVGGHVVTHRAVPYTATDIMDAIARGRWMQHDNGLVPEK